MRTVPTTFCGLNFLPGTRLAPGRAGSKFARGLVYARRGQFALIVHLDTYAPPPQPTLAAKQENANSEVDLSRAASAHLGSRGKGLEICHKGALMFSGSGTCYQDAGGAILFEPALRIQIYRGRMQ